MRKFLVLFLPIATPILIGTLLIRCTQITRSQEDQ